MLLLRGRGRPAADRANGAGVHNAAAAEWTNRDAAIVGWPLRAGDPTRVDGYRLMYRLGAGGMADVFYALAPAGGPVAVKLLRVGGTGPRTCQREYRLASAVDADCTAAALGYGLSTAGAYLVTAYLPGYRSATTLEGGPTPAAQLWTFGSALARALAGVQARGVVYCDVKPANLLIRGRTSA